MEDVRFTFPTDPVPLDQFRFAGTGAITLRRLHFDTLPTQAGHYLAAHGGGANLVLTIADSVPGYAPPEYIFTDQSQTVVIWGDDTVDGDGDGLVDADEFDSQASGEPANPGRLDSDGDGVGDGAEVWFGTNPSSGSDAPIAFGTTTSALQGSGPIRLQIASLTGDDSDNDVAVADEKTDRIYLFGNDGAGAFPSIDQTINLGIQLRDIRAATDLIFYSFGNQVVRLRTSTNQFSSFPISAGFEPRPLGFFDFDGSADPQRVLAAYSPSTGNVSCDGVQVPTCVVLLSVAQPPDPILYFHSAEMVGTTALEGGMFREPSLVTPNPPTPGFAALNESTVTVWARGNASGPPPPPIEQRASLALNAPVAFAVGDLGDAAEDDIVISSRRGSAIGQNQIGVYHQSVQGSSLVSQALLPFPIDEITALSIADVDDNGLNDIIGVSPDVDGLAVWLQLESGEFYLSVFPAGVGAGATLVEAGDVSLSVPCAVSARADVGVIVTWCMEVSP
jgi:hypothetical protein